MTKEEILAMEAGRGLDELIEQTIFRLTRGYRDDGSRCWKDKEGNPVRSEAKPYSTDISVAWQVVEKEGAWDIKKRFRPHSDDPPGTGGRAIYQAIVFLSDYDPYEDELVNKRTGRSPWCWGLPQAICKAALIARVEEGEQ